MAKNTHPLPPVIDPCMRDTVAKLYLVDGHTKAEIAAMLPASQSTVGRFMEAHGIKARVAVKRNQCGSANSSWRGESISYGSAHSRVRSMRGKASHCEHCGRTTVPASDKGLKSYFEWANVSGRFHDYISLCRPCHSKFDKMERNFNAKKEETRPARA